MPSLPELFASGRIADLVLAVLALEAAALGLRRLRTGRGPGLGELGPFLAAGACFALALRGALVEARWPWIALALAGAFVAHLWDLRRRG